MLSTAGMVGQTATQKAKTDHMVSIGTMLSHRRFIMKYKNIFLSFEVVRSLHQRNGTVTSNNSLYKIHVLHRQNYDVISLT